VKAAKTYISCFAAFTLVSFAQEGVAMYLLLRVVGTL
jgi:hypothetical protein